MIVMAAAVLAAIAVTGSTRPSSAQGSVIIIGFFIILLILLMTGYTKYRVVAKALLKAKTQAEVLDIKVNAPWDIFLYMGEEEYVRSLERIYKKLLDASSEAKLLDTANEIIAGLPSYDPLGSTEGYYPHLAFRKVVWWYDVHKFVQAGSYYMFTFMGGDSAARNGLIGILNTHYQYMGIMYQGNPGGKEMQDLFDLIKAKTSLMCQKAGWNEIKEKTLALKFDEIAEAMKGFKRVYIV